MASDTSTSQPPDPNDTSGPGQPEPEEKVWCCEYHKMATNRASRRMADKWCPNRKRPR